MSEKKEDKIEEKLNILEVGIDKINKTLKKRELHDLVYILGSKREILRRNLLAGISRGIGTGIGFTIITAVIIYFLQKIVRLNIPVIGEYINDIIQIVQHSK
ncbi:MAG: hypothetical protein HFJ47_02770 [Clostridia bacterium]|nr:hypothetical protein [Clostridia bacterium]